MATNTWQNGGVDNNWSTAGNWDLGHKPAATEDVVMAAALDCVVNEATAALNSFDQTGYANVLSGAGNITVTVASGTSACTFDNGASHTWSGTLLLNPAAGATINLTVDGMTTCGGITIAGTTTGAVYMLDNTSLATTKIVTLTTGTLHTDGAADVSGLTHSWGNFVSASGTRTLNLGNSNIGIVTGLWDTRTGTGMTLTCGGSTITFTGGSGTIYPGQPLTYNDVVWTTTGYGSIGFANNAVFNNLTINGPASQGFYFYMGNPIIINGSLSLNGNSEANRLFIYGASSSGYRMWGVSKTWTLGGAATCRTATTQYVDFSDAELAGGAADERDLSAITGGSGDAGGNSGITFTNSTDQHWVNADGGNWSTAANWTSRIPLPQDNCIFDLAFNSGKSVVADMPRIGHDMDWSGVTYTGTKPYFAITNQIVEIGGSVTLHANMSSNVSKHVFMVGRDVCNFTNAGRGFGNYSGQTFVVAMVGGTLHLEDNFICHSYSGMAHYCGTIDAATHNVDVLISYYNSSYFHAAVRQLDMGDGTWTLEGTGNSYPWIISDTTGYTLNCGKSTIDANWGPGLNRAWRGGGLTYYNVNYKLPGNDTYYCRWYNSDTFNTLSFTSYGRILFDIGTTITANKFVINGTETNLIRLHNWDKNSPGGMVKIGGGTIQCEHLNIEGINVSPANTWYYGNHSMGGEMGLLFNGTSGYVEFPNDATANQISGCTAYSVEAWAMARTGGEGPSGRIWCGAGTCNLLLSSNNMQFSIYHTGGTTTAAVGLTNTAAFTYYTIHHVVGTYNEDADKKIKVYIDGEIQTLATDTAGDDSPSGTIANIIGNTNTDDRTWDGIIYMVRIYRDVALTAANVSTLYAAGVKASDPLGTATSEYMFNEGSGTDLDDNIGGADGTITTAEWCNTGWKSGPMPNFLPLLM